MPRIEAPSGTASMSAMSTVGIEMSASITTTVPFASNVLCETISDTSSRPKARAKQTVSTTMARFVREPAMSQLSTSAPVPSVPSQCSRDGFAHTL